jgi:hypothetical protein
VNIRSSHAQLVRVRGLGLTLAALIPEVTPKLLRGLRFILNMLKILEMLKLLRHLSTYQTARGLLLIEKSLQLAKFAAT